MIRHLLSHILRTYRWWEDPVRCYWCEKRNRRALDRNHETVKRLQRQKIEKLTQELEAAKATLDRAMEVVRAAEAWRTRPRRAHHETDLIAAVDSWNGEASHD